MKSVIKSGDGIIFVAFGRPYLALAAVAAASVKANNPDLGAAVITNVAPEPDSAKDFLPFDYWIYENVPTRVNRQYKVSVNGYSPFSRTVMMDCDTVAIADISDLFSYLDYKDTAMQITGLIPEYGHRDVLVLNGRRIGDLPHWNSGILAFADRPEVDQFFDNWQRAFMRLGLNSDQPALVEAVFRSSARQISLDHRWNCSGNQYLKERSTKSGDKLKIIHQMSGFLGADVERYLRNVDGVLEEHLGLQSRGEVEAYIAKRHERRSAALPEVQLIPHELVFGDK